MPKSGKVILSASAYLWSMESLRSVQAYPTLAFFLNSVSSLALSGEDLELRALRNKQQTIRVIPTISASSKTWWKATQTLAPVIAISLLGIAVLGYRRIRRDRYEKQSGLRNIE